MEDPDSFHPALDMSGEISVGSIESYHGLTVHEASMACLSAIIGGGIVGFPYAFYHMGVPLGIFFTLFIAICTHKAIKLLILTSHLIPGQPESYYEIAYMTLGRNSIFIIAGIIGFVSLGLMMIYFIILGGIAQTLVKQLFLEDNYDGILNY